jgi:cation:H+ antiporter
METSVSQVALPPERRTALLCNFVDYTCHLSPLGYAIDPHAMIDILIILATLVGLGIGGHYFVSGAAAIGQKCGLSPVVIGATIVAIGTSLPEWAISVIAAFNGAADLSVGNVVGSNICNVCIVLGLAALVAPIEVHRSALVRDAIIMVSATALLIAFTLDGKIDRFEGSILLLCGGLTVAAILKLGKEEIDPIEKFHWWQIPVAVLALVLILVSSHFFVESAVVVAKRLNVSEWAIGLTVAAIGTSLPELVTALAAAMQKKTGMIVGNVIGSNIMNIFFVLGSAATVQVLDTRQFTTQQAVSFTILMVLSVALLYTGNLLKRWEGILLLAAGFGWYAIEMVSF